MLSLPYGTSSVSCSIPEERYDLIKYAGDDRPSASVPIEELLNKPIGSPPLEELAKGKQRAVILISDGSRLCPTHSFIDLIVDRLLRGGMRLDQLTIIVALGLHRKHTEEELRQLVGASAYERVRVVNHSALPEDCMLVGHTSRGTPVEINRTVVDADLRIAIGNIEPHRLVGMSGGVKALVPGVASSRCIEAHHSMSQQYKAQPGDVQNPLHQDLVEAEQLVPIHFLMNVIVNQQRAILHAVCGQVQKAHRQGLSFTRGLFHHNVDKLYDLVIVSPGGHPKDIQLYQTVKTLENASQITKPGGSIVCIARCEEHYGNGELQSWIETIQTPDVMLERLKQRFVIGAHKVEHIQNLVHKHQIYLYSEMPDPIVRLIGFEPLPELDPFLKAQITDPHIDIAVMPYGALTFPTYTPKEVQV